MTADGRKRQQQRALIHKPWEHSTGPTSVEGKERIRQAASRRRKGPHTVRERRQLTADLRGLLVASRSVRRQALHTAARQQVNVFSTFISDKVKE